MCPEDHPHNRSCYSNHACRCDTCRAANSEGCRKARRLRDPSRLPASAHGKTQTYTNWNCRCEPCTEAHNAACAAHRRMRLARGGAR